MMLGGRSLVGMSSWKGFPKVTSKLNLENGEELTKKVRETRLFPCRKKNK